MAISPSEYANDGVVYESGGVKVTAFEVDHGDLIKPTYSYRVGYGTTTNGRSSSPPIRAKNIAPTVANIERKTHEKFSGPLAFGTDPMHSTSEKTR